MITINDGIEFDPGFTMHLSLITRDIQNFYYNLSACSKFPQKKQQFKIYSPKLWRLVERNIGFYAACVLWADFAQNHKDKLILNNICFGGEYSEEDNVSEVKFLKEFLEQYKKDVKYYSGQEFAIPQSFVEILNDYEEFLKVNEGFVKVEKAGDLKLPQGVKTLVAESEFLEKVEQVVESGNFAPMIEYYSTVK